MAVVLGIDCSDTNSVEEDYEVLLLEVAALFLLRDEFIVVLS